MSLRNQTLTSKIQIKDSYFNIKDFIRNYSIDNGIEVSTQILEKKENLFFDNIPVFNSIRNEQLRNNNIKIDTEGTQIINAWKLTSVFPSRLIEVTSSFVLLEVIVDDNIFEEQEYDLILFDGFDLNKIKFFNIKCYERPREQKIVMTDGTDFLKREDFPIVDFSDLNDNNLIF